MRYSKFKNWHAQYQSAYGYKQCCAMGMHMATIETMEEVICITNAYFKSNYWFPPHSVLQSNFYFFIDLTFSALRTERVTLVSTVYFENEVAYWCSTNQPLSRGLSGLPWLTHEPDNAYPPEGVMYFGQYGSGSLGLADGNSLANWNYMCQWPWA